MIRPISASALVCALFAISMTAYAQGRPAGAGSKGGGSRPSMSQQQDRSASMRQDFELRRQQTEARRLAAEDKRLAAESAHAKGPPAETPPADAVAKRVAAELNNISADMRALHQPAATLPEEAGLQSGNDRNAIDRGSHRNTQGVAQRDTHADDAGEMADAD